jgi:hypothetical protein
VSRENVETVRASYEAQARGDLEAALAAADPEIEVYDHDILDAREYRGVEGVLRWHADWETPQPRPEVNGTSHPLRSRPWQQVCKLLSLGRYVGAGLESTASSSRG